MNQQVEIKIEVLEEEDEDEIFDMEMTEHAADMATKLDALMDVLYSFIFRESQRSEKHREQMFVMLMQLFDAFILKTHKSKYVQFLLFYICAMDINYTHVRSTSSSSPVLGTTQSHPPLLAHNRPLCVTCWRR
jgi:RNA polymerase I-specific transcription initiation factor RRN3